MSDARPAREARLRFSAFRLERLPDGRCRGEVTLEGRDGVPIRGTADGLASSQGELRCAAEACLAALEQAIGARIRFELLGVKAVRAFDANVVIVSVAARAESDRRLVGSVLAEHDLARGAVLAVLHATNRLLGNHLHVP